RILRRLRGGVGAASGERGGKFSGRITVGDVGAFLEHEHREDVFSIGDVVVGAKGYRALLYVARRTAHRQHWRHLQQVVSILRRLRDAGRSEHVAVPIEDKRVYRKRIAQHPGGPEKDIIGFHVHALKVGLANAVVADDGELWLVVRGIVRRKDVHIGA